MNVQETAENIIRYIRRNEPEEISIDICGPGLAIHDYVEVAIKGSPTKLKKVRALNKSNEMAFATLK